MSSLLAAYSTNQHKHRYQMFYDASDWLIQCKYQYLQQEKKNVLILQKVSFVSDNIFYPSQPFIHHEALAFSSEYHW